MRMRLPLAFAAIAACAGVDLPAADANPLAAGKRVRLTTLPPPPAPNNPDAFVGFTVGSDRDGVTLRGPDGQPITLARKNRRLRGRLVASDDQALMLELPGVKEPVRVPRASITGIEMSRGKNRLAGAGFGGLAGFTFGYYAGSCPPNTLSCFFTPKALGLTLALSGALVGALGAPECWTVVEDRRVKVGLGAPIRPGPGLNVSIRF